MRLFNTFNRRKILLLATAVYLSGWLGVAYDDVSAQPRGLVFPVVGGGTFTNDFNSPRTNGLHNATDIMAPKGRHIVAAVAGRVTFVPTTQPSYGYMVQVTDADGFKYDYIHMNNDTPGTDDGRGTAYTAYAPDIYQGATVVRGQLLGYVGDSGNAENTAPHLHFEITDKDGQTKVNPYPYLQEAQRLDAPAIYPPVRNEILPYGPYVFTQPSITMGRFETQVRNNILVATGKGYPPHTRILRQDNTEYLGFYAYSPNFTGGVQVAAGDFDGDGKDEIITAPGPGGGPHVRILKIEGTNITEYAGFYAYNPNWPGGLDVSAGDVSGDTKDEVVTAAGPGAGAHVRIFNGDGGALDDGFNAYPDFNGGAKVSIGNVNLQTPKMEILTTSWDSGPSQVKAFTAAGKLERQHESVESWWKGSFDIAAGDGITYVTTGTNRRTTIRQAVEN